MVSLMVKYTNNPNVLKFYIKEDQIFKEERKIIIQDKDINKLSKKLAKHFKFSYKGYVYKKTKWLGSTSINQIITYNKDIDVTLLTLVHELTHLWQLSKYGSWSYRKVHNKEMLKIERKMFNYCYKNKSIVYILGLH